MSSHDTAAHPVLEVPGRWVLVAAVEVMVAVEAVVIVQCLLVCTQVKKEPTAVTEMLMVMKVKDDPPLRRILSAGEMPLLKDQRTHQERTTFPILNVPF